MSKTKFEEKVAALSGENKRIYEYYSTHYANTSDPEFFRYWRLLYELQEETDDEQD